MNGGTGFLLGCDLGPTRIVDRVIHAIFQFAILFLHLLLFLFQQLLHFFQIIVHRVGEVAEAIGKHIGIGQAHDGHANGLRQRFAVNEVGVGEVRVPVEVVVNGVIDSLAIFSAITEIERRDSEMMLENGVIGARSEREQASSRCDCELARAPRRPCASWMRSACARFHTEMLASGSCTSRATPLTSASSECAPSASRKPRPLPSVLM